MLKWFILCVSFIQYSYSTIGLRTIRIYADYTTLDYLTFDVNYKNKLKELINDTIDKLQAILLVPMADNNLIIKNCNPNLLSDITITTTGIPADFIIFPVIETELDSLGFDFDGIHCVLDNVTNRPLAGILRISSQLILNAQNSEEYYKMKVSTLLNVAS